MIIAEGLGEEVLIDTLPAQEVLIVHRPLLQDLRRKRAQRHAVSAGVVAAAVRGKDRVSVVI